MFSKDLRLIYNVSLLVDPNKHGTRKCFHGRSYHWGHWSHVVELCIGRILRCVSQYRYVSWYVSRYAGYWYITKDRSQRFYNKSPGVCQKKWSQIKKFTSTQTQIIVEFIKFVFGWFLRCFVSKIKNKILKFNPRIQNFLSEYRN